MVSELKENRSVFSGESRDTVSILKLQILQEKSGFFPIQTARVTKQLFTVRTEDGRERIHCIDFRESMNKDFGAEGNISNVLQKEKAIDDCEAFPDVVTVDEKNSEYSNGYCSALGELVEFNAEVDSNDEDSFNLCIIKVEGNYSAKPEFGFNDSIAEEPILEDMEQDCVEISFEDPHVVDLITDDDEFETESSVMMHTNQPPTTDEVIELE